MERPEKEKIYNELLKGICRFFQTLEDQNYSQRSYKAIVEDPVYRYQNDPIFHTRVKVMVSAFFILLDSQNIFSYHDHLESQLAESQKEVERLRGIFQKLKEWSQAYPVKVFPEPNLDKAHKVLKENDMTLDAISASSFRYVLSGIRDYVMEALKGGK